MTLIVEKFQIQSLAIGLEQFLTELDEKYPGLPEAPADYQEEKMHIHPPVEPLFRVGEIGLGYDVEDDLLILVAREAVPEEVDTEQAGVVRFWCTRAQLRSMSSVGDLSAHNVVNQWTLKVISVPKKMGINIDLWLSLCI